jgi:hypothetical protein
VTAKRKSDELSDEEAERRATEALRRTLTTPYKPQKDMVGKLGRACKQPVAPKGRPKNS